MIKKTLTLLTAFTLAIAVFQPTTAQLKLPQPSPDASVSQKFGLTEVSIEYSSPGVKGRSIFGGLVPYNELWRTGANSATKIEFSNDVTIEGNKVPKGIYSLFTIPMAGEFTVILNKNLSASTGTYKKEEDVVRFNVKTKAIENRERMAFMFSNFTDPQITVDLEWEKTRVSFVVSTETDAQAKKNIESELGKTWRTYNSAARYYLDNKSELATGMKYVDQSLSLKEEWYNSWTKAQLYSAMNQPADAYKWAMKAKELGDKNPDGFFYKDQVEKALVDWKPSSDKKGKK